MKVIDRGKRSKTLSEVKPVENKHFRKFLIAFIKINPQNFLLCNKKNSDLLIPQKVLQKFFFYFHLI